MTGNVMAIVAFADIATGLTIAPRTKLEPERRT
jgi:hypothetical protein